jgi:hypothetical protein
MASQLTAGMPLGGRSTAWYQQEEATVSDVLAFVRRAMWAGKDFNKSTCQDDQVI